MGASTRRVMHIRAAAGPLSEGRDRAGMLQRGHRTAVEGVRQKDRHG